MGTSLLSRMAHLFQSAGQLFGGSRDLYDVFGWNKNPQHKDFITKYRRQGMAKRIVNAPVAALWSDPPKLEGDAAFITAWNNLLEQVPVFHYIQRLDKLAGLGKFAIMVIGFESGDLESPVSKKEGQRVLYLQPYAEGSVKVNKWITEKKDPRYGMPEVYEINPGKLGDDNNRTISSLTSPPNSSFKVHWSRVLHVAEGLLESSVYGCSRLESCYNELDDIWKVTGGAAETYWLAGNRGLHVDVDKEMDLEKDDEEALDAELNEYQHELRRIIRTRGVAVKEISGTVADPTGPFEVLLTMISTDTGIPKRVLTGSEAGQLASQQDRANWAQRCEERIKEYGEPVIFLPFLRLLINAGTLPQPTELIIDWPDSFKMNPLERAQTSAQMARSATNLANSLKTIQGINEANARAAQPQPLPTVGGGGLFGNADPKKPASTPAKTAPTEHQLAPMGDALLPKQPIIELLTIDECRDIIGFGKHPPVFDNKKDTKPAVGSGK